jgi:hypothetical protein
MGTAGHRADRRPSLRHEFFVWLGVLIFYFVLTSLDWPGRHSAAITNSRALYDLERSLNIDVELALNTWLVPHRWLRTLANYEYAITYLVSSFGLLIWLYLRRPSTYFWARTSFIALNVVALTCFAVYPVAPPRVLPDLGFTDTIVQDGTWLSWGSPMAEHANQLAAMPSLHIGWAVWVSLILASIASDWRSQAASGVHVVVTLFVIMATANHYLIDAAAGALLAYAAVVVTRPRAVSTEQVGGLVVVNASRALEGEFRRTVERVARRHVRRSPRLRQRRFSPSRWGPPRWIDHPDLDWSWHVSERPLASPEASLHQLVAEVANTPLPVDRPPWRLLIVSGKGARRPAVIVVAHHAVADGLDAIAAELGTPHKAAIRLQPQDDAF